MCTLLIGAVINVLKKKNLYQMLRTVDADDILILGGDWNCINVLSQDSNGEEPHPPSASVLESVVNSMDLVDVWREKNTGVRQYTWINASVNRIDRLYISCAWNRVTVVRIHPSTFSDHHRATLAVSLAQDSLRIFGNIGENKSFYKRVNYSGR